MINGKESNDATQPGGAIDGVRGDALATRATQLVALWVVCALLTLGTAAAFASPWAAIAVAAAGTAAIALLARRTIVVVPAALALVPAVAGHGAIGILWLAAAALLAFATAQTRRVVRVEMNELQRHLSWSRRRDEQASVLVAWLPSEAVEGGERTLVATFRITDSIAMHRRAGGYELQAVLDHEGLDRAVVEARLRQATDSDVRAGWATFPDEGVTLCALLDQARARMRRRAVGDVVRLPARPAGVRATTTSDGAAVKGA